MVVTGIRRLQSGKLAGAHGQINSPDSVLREHPLPSSIATSDPISDPIPSGTQPPLPGMLALHDSTSGPFSPLLCL